MRNIVEILKRYPDYISYYWNYQYRLGSDYIISYFKDSGIHLEDKSILEIGAGEGGVLTALSQQNAHKAIGFDIRDGVVSAANNIANDLQSNCKFYVHNIYDEKIPEEWKSSFDIILMRDVIEHLDNTESSLRQILKFARHNSYIFITFPPYYSAYGAHQHTLKNLPGKIPFIQLLPDTIFKYLINSGRKADKEEVNRLRKIKLTIKKFKDAAEKVGLSIIDEKLFFSRPVFKIKFGLPVISINFLKNLPLIRELIPTEASFILKTREK
jgi:SAM-dependent methyltransferase